MKTLLLCLLCLASTAALAKEIVKVESKLVQKGGYVSVTVNSEEITLFSSDGDGIEIVDGIFVANFQSKNKKIILANAGAELEQRTTSSIETVLVRVVKDKMSKKFHATQCSHIGCFPFPHFEDERKLVLEIEAMDGNKVCYRNSPKWTAGKCK